jgi:YD repeat-containing protein
MVMNGDHATEVRGQVRRLISHPLLRNSRRCRNFLQFVVEETLKGRGAELKERTVGVAVFGRALEYDTNLDHVVRTAACDLRRRLALYYREPDRRDELRIILPAGTYTPVFQSLAESKSPPFQPHAVPAVMDPPAPVKALPPKALSAHRAPWYVLAGLIVLAAGAIVGLETWPRRSASDNFWQPFLDSPDPVLLCVGTFFVPESVMQEADTLPSRFTRYVQQAMPILISSGDTSSIARVAGFLAAKGKRFRIRTQSSSTLADLREGPVVLIGAFNNAWSLRLSDQMRYRLVWDAERNLIRINDTRNPSEERWKASANWPIEPGTQQLKEDFALISRIWDSTTGRPVLIAGGLTMLGTAAAGEFLSDPKHMEELAAAVPKGWDRKNLQVVIATRLIGGESSPPRVQAVESW